MDRIVYKLKKKNEKKLKARVKTDNRKINNSENSFFGEMTYKCKWCSAFYWKE